VQERGDAVKEKQTTETAYSRAGVNIDAGMDAVKLMGSAVRSTWDENVCCDYGAFAGLYDLAKAGCGRDILAVTIDGVGTKLKIATMMGRYDTVGQDLVNHCVDDLLVQRARPLIFADYFASSCITPEHVAETVQGMAEACRAVGCNLLAGETAEMPGVYCEGEIDLVGCMIGIVRKTDVDGVPPIAPGDVLLGLPSTGLHTNGYSLARHLLFKEEGLTVDSRVPDLGCTVGEELLKIHREYLSAIEPFLGDKRVHGLAHITGGGLYDNVRRVLPDGCDARIDTSTWEPLPIFRLLRTIGELTIEEAYRALNMGIGLVLIVDGAAADGIRTTLETHSHETFVIGDISKGDGSVRLQ
jgi:phosphoribosylformylglycinamidine cyclo-ligase